MNPEAVAVAIEGVGEVLRCPRCGGELVRDPEMSAMLTVLDVYHCRECGLEEWRVRR